MGTLIGECQVVTPAGTSRINTSYDELNPVLSPDRNLYFTRANHPGNVGGVRDPGDIWFCKPTQNGWSEPQHAGREINDRAYNGVASFSTSGDVIYLLSHYDPSGRAKTQGLSYSQKQGAGWSRPVNLSIPYFQNKSSVVSGSLSRDLRVFVFSAETYGTKGVEDIYVARKNADGTWAAPINLGTIINTQFQEVCPSLSADGYTLYFSSNGRKGAGSFDVYKSQRLDDTWTRWSEPVNLGNAVNTEGREWYFREHAEAGLSLYVSTTNSDGYGDIRVLANPEGPVIPPQPTDTLAPVATDTPAVTDNKVRVFGHIIDGKSGQYVRARMQIRAGDADQVVEFGGPEGFEIRVEKKQVYSLTIEAQGYISSLQPLDLSTFEGAELEMNFNLQPVERGMTVNLKSVLFEQSKTTLLTSSYAELDVVVSFMNENPNVSIELSGHTDNRGNPTDNVKLSQERVDTVKEYLVSKGIDSRRITGKGYGGSKPIASNATEETRMLNRRVEFTIKKL
jgi:outer membrane protein OmpA-like peptidoglycan-associated protein